MAKKGLGRGLGALIPGLNQQSASNAAPAPAAPAASVIEIPITQIDANPDQPRRAFSEDSLQELQTSITEVGVIQPVLVRRVGGRYELIAGERRWRAAKAAGLTSLPVVVRDADDRFSMQMALIENLQREDLNAVEEAEAYEHLIRDFQVTQSDLARMVGKSRSAISNCLRLLALPDEVKAELVSGRITSGHARALLVLSDPDEQKALAERIAYERLSVREVELVVGAVARSQEADLPADRDVVSGRRAPAPAPAALDEVARELASHLSVPVKIGVSGKKGYLRISFSTSEDFQRIVGALRGAGSAEVG